MGEAANWIEKALARAIPIMIAFLARLLGISGVTDKIVRTIKKIQAKVDRLSRSPRRMEKRIHSRSIRRRRRAS